MQHNSGFQSFYIGGPVKIKQMFTDRYPKLDGYDNYLCSYYRT